MPALFLETIRLESGIPQNLVRHVERMKQTAIDKQFKVPTLPDLEDLCPKELRHGSTVKCRVIYRDSIESISFDAYTPRTILTLALAKLPEDFDYSYKYLRRHILDELRLASGCDEVLLYNSEGLLSDSSFSNLIFEREDGVWITPDRPLLNGTMRQALLKEDKGSNAPMIKEGSIRIEDLPLFKRVAFINAMLPFEKAIVCPLSHLKKK